MQRVFLYIFFVFSLSVFAQNTSFYAYDTLVSSIYNVNNDVYSQIVDLEDQDYVKVLYEAYYWFWLAIVKDDMGGMQQAENCLEKVDLAQIEDPLLQVSLALLTMRIALINKSYLSAIQPQMIIRRYFSQDEFVNKPYDRFLRGMYHYFVTYGRNESLFYRMCLLGWPEADAEKGLLYLNEMTTSSSTMIATEACYFLGRIYLEYENDSQRAKLLFKQLHKKYPNNSIYADFLEQCK